jgi:signal transduction histidine kinase
MKSHSLSRRLIFLVLAIELTSAFCVSGVALLYERHTHFRSFDILLRGRADSLLGAVQDAEDVEDNVMLDGSQKTLPTEDVFEVLDENGRVVGKSANWQGSAALLSFREMRMRPERTPNLDSEEAFLNTEVGGELYRVIHIKGLRVVDAGDKGGGVQRRVTVCYGSPVRRVWSAVYRAVAFYAMTSLVVLALTGILMSWLLNRSLQSLRELAAAAEGVSVTSWAFAPPESARRVRELEPLVVALEKVLAGLQLAFERQHRFVGDATHELKTGVAVVKSSIQLLTMKPRTIEEYQSGLERCLSDCQRMEALVAQMLALARIEEDPKSSAVDSSADVDACIEQVLREMEPVLEGKGIGVALISSESWSRGTGIRVDSAQFRLLVSNLLMNSLQHSAIGSVIDVQRALAGDHARIEIRDAGDGIAASELPTIFDRFSRGDPSRSRSTGGTGLGLAICKAIVDRFHGRINLASELGVGTAVTVFFPLAETNAPSI